jgi:GNAT superfamily N-acetyltransferase
MSSQAPRIRAIKPDDKDSGFNCGVKALDDYFLKHAHTNHEADVGRAYVMEASTSEIESGLPPVLGFYTLSMASVLSKDAASVLGKQLPRYPMPAALIGRLAVDHRAQGRRLGGRLLGDALQRVFQASETLREALKDK